MTETRSVPRVYRPRRGWCNNLGTTMLGFATCGLGSGGVSRTALIDRFVGGMNLRFPTLFVLLAAVFLVDLVFPDFLPFVDEIGLALLTALFGLWRKRRNGSSSPVAAKNGA